MESLIENYLVDLYNVINVDNCNNLSILNKHVEKIYIINLKSDNLRREYIKILFQKLNINYNLIRVDTPNLGLYNKFISLCNKGYQKMSIGEVGCYLSHMWCLNDIIKNNIKNAIIFEDDIVVHKNFENLYKKIVMKQDWDFLILGCGDYGFNKGNCDLIKDNIYIPKYYLVLGTHSIYYSNKAANLFYDKRLKDPVYFDKDLIGIFKLFDENKSGIIYPNLFTIENSTSNLNHNLGISKFENNDFYYTRCYNNFNFKDYYMIYLDLFKKYILEDFSNWFNISMREIIVNLLKNYFNNNNNLIELHLNNLDNNFFSQHDYYNLINSICKEIDYDYYKNFKIELCKKYNCTTGYLIKNNISRCKNISNLFYKENLKSEIKERKIKYKIYNLIEKKYKFVAHLHCFDLKDFKTIYMKYFKKIINNFDIVITYCNYINYYDYELNEMLKLCTIIECPNKGMDIGPKFVMVNYLNTYKKDYSYILFLHSKSCNKTRDLYFSSLINNLNSKIKIIESEKIGGFFPPTVHIGNNFSIIYNEKYLQSNQLKKILYINFSNNKYYVNELLNYFNICEKEITLWSSGNCYLLHKDIANILYSDVRLYNCLNQVHENGDYQSVECFDYNWIRINYNLKFYNIDYLYEFSKKNNFKMNVLQEEKNQFQLRDGMIEHAFERIIFQIIFNTKNKFDDYYEIEILPNSINKNYKFIKDLSNEINLCYKNRVKYQDFNYENYIEKNIDLKGKIINKEQAWNHWVKYGIDEGREL